MNLEQIKRRAEKATPGPWTNEPDTGAGRVWVQRSEARRGKDCAPLFEVRGRDAYEQRAADAEFIAHAREDIPALVGRVEELEAALRDLVENCLEPGRRFSARERAASALASLPVREETNQ